MSATRPTTSALRNRGTWPATSRRPGTCSAAGALQLALAQLDPADLPGQGLREIVDELDQARVGVGAEVPADEGLDLLGDLVGGLVAVVEHDERLDDVALDLVG